MIFKPTYHERNIMNLKKLGPNTRAAAEKWYQYCIDKKVDVLIYETIRTVEEQKRNVAGGKSQTMKSYHLVGQALDFVPIKNNKSDWNGYNEKSIQEVIAYAKKIGFEWGGDWKGFVDSPHLQYNYKGYGTDKSVTSTVKESNASVPYPGILKNGSKGKNVERIQKVLKLKVDGIFGDDTEKAVKSYQKQNNLNADGIVGKSTWNKMF